jgi:hypothetical protein
MIYDQGPQKILSADCDTFGLTVSKVLSSSLVLP